MTQYYHGLNGERYSGPPPAPLPPRDGDGDGDAPLPAVSFQRVAYTHELVSADARHCRGSALATLRWGLCFRQRPARPSPQPPVRSEVPLSEVIGQDAADRLHDSWLDIAPDPTRDALFQRILRNGRVSAALKALCTRVEANLREEEDYTEPLVAPDIGRFAEVLRTAIRRALGLPDLPDGWGACFTHGKRRLVANPDPRSKADYRPDVVFFSQRPAERGKASVHWADIISVAEIKTERLTDLGDDLARQMLRYVRAIKTAHPICSTVHALTVCGPLVRLWTFGPGAFTTSLARSFLNEEDVLPITRMFALMVGPEPSNLLGHWAPPQTFRVLPHEGHGQQEQAWTWVDPAGPRVVFVQPEIFGSHTVIWGRLAIPSQPAHGHAGEEQQSTSLEADKLKTARTRGDKARNEKAASPKMTFVKALHVLEHLEGHELRIQHKTKDVPGNPVPLGVVDTSDCSWPPSQRTGASTRANTYPGSPLSRAGGEEERLVLHAFAYHHRLGKEMPAYLSERDMCCIFSQLPPILLQYARRQVHYRDLNPTNVLYEESPSGLKLILVDHGNARVAMPRWNGLETPEQRMRLFTVVARDDATAGNTLFLPSGAHHLETVLNELRAAEMRRSVPGAKASRSRARLEELWAGQRSPSPPRRDPAVTLRLHHHTYLDDLEAICYVLVLSGAERSFDAADYRLAEVERTLADLSKKWALWTSPEDWVDFVYAYCPSMSETWLRMMNRLHFHILTAQTARRKDLQERFVNGGGLQELFRRRRPSRLQTKRASPSVQRCCGRSQCRSPMVNLRWGLSSPCISGPPTSF